MAAAPRLKVYTAKGEYIAACKHPEDAAAVLSINPGGTIRLGHNRVLYGPEDQDAGESYDHVAETVVARAGAAWRE